MKYRVLEEYKRVQEYLVKKETLVPILRSILTIIDPLQKSLRTMKSLSLQIVSS